MSQFENQQQFRRNLILNRVRLHLAQQQDEALSDSISCAILQARELVIKTHMAAILEDDLKFDADRKTLKRGARS